MADMHRILEVEMGGQRREIVGIVVHVVAVGDLARAAVAAPVMRDDAEAVLQEEQHLRVPVICRQRPAMAEDDGLARAPVLVEDHGPVIGGDRRHDVDPPRCHQFGACAAAHIRRPEDNVRGWRYLNNRSDHSATNSSAPSSA
jgi:hypothetical protein